MEKEKFSWLISKNKVADDNLHFQWHTNFLVKLQCSVFFISLFAFRRQQAEFFLFKKIRKINAGQYKIPSTSPVKILQSPDANQGVQAQTVSNFYLAFSNNLAIVPVCNKIDMKNANPEAVKEQLLNLFEIDPSEVILASGKTGIGISEIFEVSQ